MVVLTVSKPRVGVVVFFCFVIWRSRV